MLVKPWLMMETVNLFSSKTKVQKKGEPKENKNNKVQNQGKFRSMIRQRMKKTHKNQVFPASPEIPTNSSPLQAVNFESFSNFTTQKPPFKEDQKKLNSPGIEEGNNFGRMKSLDRDDRIQTSETESRRAARRKAFFPSFFGSFSTSRKMENPESEVGILPLKKATKNTVFGAKGSSLENKSETRSSYKEKSSPKSGRSVVIPKITNFYHIRNTNTIFGDEEKKIPPLENIGLGLKMSINLIASRFKEYERQSKQCSREISQHEFGSSVDESTVGRAPKECLRKTKKPRELLSPPKNLLRVKSLQPKKSPPFLRENEANLLKKTPHNIKELSFSRQFSRAGSGSKYLRTNRVQVPSKISFEGFLTEREQSNKPKQSFFLPKL